MSVSAGELKHHNHHHPHRRSLLSRRALVDLTDLRVAGAVALGAGALLPLLGHPGPGCVLRAATGIPCPLCGMSTSVQDTLRLDLESALVANPAGVAVVVASAALLMYRKPRRLAVPVWLPVVALAAMWIYQLVRYSVL
jgi:hypothetical protein